MDPSHPAVTRTLGLESVRVVGGGGGVGGPFELVRYITLQFNTGIMR